MRPRLGLALLGILAVLPPLFLSAGVAWAHPHAWFDVMVEVRFSGDGAVTGLHETWLLDEFYTTYATEGLETGPDGAPTQAVLDALLRENMRNLAEYGYFTQVHLGDEAVATGPASDLESGMQGKRIRMSFLLPLVRPVPLHGETPLTYSIFDPTYYIEMLHAESPDAIRLVDAPSGCTHRLIHPKPSFEAQMLALNLDKGQTAGDGLGALFAERVEIWCP